MQVAKPAGSLALKKNKIVLALLVLAASGSAMAADPTPPDPAIIVAYIAAAGLTMVAIANAKLLMELGIKAFRWIRQALGG